MKALDIPTSTCSRCSVKPCRAGVPPVGWSISYVVTFWTRARTNPAPPAASRRCLWPSVRSNTPPPSLASNPALWSGRTSCSRQVAAKNATKISRARNHSRFSSFPSYNVSGELELEATLDKQLYHHGDTISISVTVRNKSNKSVKKMAVSILQCIDIAMFTGGHCKVRISHVETAEGCPVEPGSTMQKVRTNFFRIRRRSANSFFSCKLSVPRSRVA